MANKKVKYPRIGTDEERSTSYAEETLKKLKKKRLEKKRKENQLTQDVISPWGMGDGGAEGDIPG